MYITAKEYEAITGREKEEATEARRKYASQLLDARIGQRFACRGFRPLMRHKHPPQDTMWKLDLDRLYEYQVQAVKTWCARVVEYLFDNGDSFDNASSLMLGRFQETKPNSRTGEDKPFPDELRFADQVLIDSGLIKRKVKLK